MNTVLFIDNEFEVEPQYPAMSHTFSDESSGNRKKVVHALTVDLNRVNISLAYNGLFRYEDNLVCGKSRTEGTEFQMFWFDVDLIAENPEGPPVLNLKQLDVIIRRIAFERGVTLTVDKHHMFVVKAGAGINVATKKTPKMKIIVEEPNPALTFVPGMINLAEPEKRMLFVFYGDPGKAKADMANHLGGSKVTNDAKIYNACQLTCSQLSLHYSDGKHDLPDYLLDFSFDTAVAMHSLLHQARDMVIEEKKFINAATGKSLILLNTI